MSSIVLSESKTEFLRIKYAYILNFNSSESGIFLNYCILKYTSDPHGLLVQFELEQNCMSKKPLIGDTFGH